MNSPCADRAYSLAWRSRGQDRPGVCARRRASAFCGIGIHVCSPSEWAFEPTRRENREDDTMNIRQHLYSSAAAVGIAAMAGAAPLPANAQQASVAIDADDIGGLVRGPNGPEAGVWVIAETTDLPTKFAKMVVTDDQGRYLIPDLPTANYRVWVRGYGLVDSPKLRGKPGEQLNHAALPAPDERTAAHYYPAIYW